MSGQAASPPGVPRTVNFSRLVPLHEDITSRPQRTVTFGAVHTIRAYYDSDEGRSDDEDDEEEETLILHPKLAPRPSIDSACDTSHAGAHRTRSTDAARGGPLDHHEPAPPKPVEPRGDRSRHLTAPPASRPSASRTRSPAAVSPAIGPRLNVPCAVSARLPPRRASPSRSLLTSPSAPSLHTSEQEPQRSSLRIAAFVGGSRSSGHVNVDDNNNGAADEEDDVESEGHNLDDARSHHTVSELDAAIGSVDGDGRWQSSSCDISSLSDKQLQRLRRRGVNPALYLEMQAARKGRPRWLGALAGNTFLN